MAINFNKIPKFKLPKRKETLFGNFDQMLDPANEENLKHIRAQLRARIDQQKYYDGTDFKTVKEIFDKSTVKYADRPLFLEVFNKKTGFEEITYGQFRSDVINFGTALLRELHLSGKKVIIIGETTYQWYVSYVALLSAGIIAVPVDKVSPQAELENLIKRSEATAIICTSKKADIALKAAARSESVKYVIEMYSHDIGTTDKKGRLFYSFGMDFLIDEGKVLTELGDTSLMDVEIDPEAFALLIFTSGTTSAAKGVMISNHNLAANINAITPFVKLTPEDRLLSVLPLHHTYESTIGFIYPMSMGASIAICQGLKHLVSDMELTHPTSIIAVPLLIETIHKRIMKSLEKAGKASQVATMMKVSDSLRSIGFDTTRAMFDPIYQSLGGNLRIIVSAAAPIDKKVGCWFESLGITFLQGYGLTETAPISALTPDFDLRVGSAGRCVRGNELRVHDPNANGEGEIWIKGETVMLGYYNDPEATAAVMEDGWFNSGDIGYIDADGFLYITGRSKNVIVTQNGKNIYPEELEGLLNRQDVVAECMVYGKEVPGEKELVVTARIIPDYKQIEALYGAEVAEDETRVNDLVKEAIKSINETVPNYKFIRDHEIKHDAFEKTSTMKIKRYKELSKDNN